MDGRFIGRVGETLFNVGDLILHGWRKVVLFLKVFYDDDIYEYLQTFVRLQLSDLIVWLLFMK